MQRLYLVTKKGFAWSDIMSMPIWEKNYYYDKLIGFEDKKQ